MDNKSIWVVFTGKTDIFWLRILKPGFRHCFVVINDGLRWISIDPLASFTDIQTYSYIEPCFDLPQWLSNRGFQVVPANFQPTRHKPAPCMFFTCVEAIKRVLGIHRRSIITPWQLYCFLNKQNKNTDKPKGKITWVL